MVASGLKFAEVTLNTEGALEMIQTASSEYGDRLTLGAGTVLHPEDARAAVNAGASFLVSPTLNEEIAGYCRQTALPYFPGAFTPTEIEKAWNAGACMVKVFPASQLGPSYFKEVRGPFPEIRMMAVGGVRPQNVGDFLSAGAQGLAVGGSIFSAERMQAGDFSSMQQDLTEILLAVKKIFH